MQPLIGLHLALLIFLGWISTCNGSTNNFREKSDNLKYIERKRNTVTNSATEFLKFNVIHPQIYHVREKRELKVENIHPKRNNDKIPIENINDLILTFSSGGQKYIVDLQLNHQLIPHGYFQKYHKNGKHVIERPSPNKIQLCHYNGKIRGIASSWAAISTCGSGIDGTLYDGKELHFIENLNKGVHYHYKSSDHTQKDFLDLQSQNSSMPKSDSTNNQKKNVYNRALRYKRDISHSKSPQTSHGGQRNVLSGGSYARTNNDQEINAEHTKIQGPWNANKQSRYVELLLVVDNKEYKDHGEDLEQIYKICKDVANVMNSLYSPLNIYIALVGVIVWTEYDEIKMSTNGDKMLTNFLHYRRERLVKEHPNDNAQLLTGILFEGGVVGKALKGPICTYEFSGGVNMWHSDTIGLIATTVAHEMGHNFGMEHDTEDCECPDDRCIMAPASSAMKPTFWSSCSLEYLAMAFDHGMDYCLRNRPTQIFDGPVCGNGFVETGEECDCGLREHCDNPCCNPDTCKLFKNATCATGSCCDFQTCQPKSPGSICRHSEHECDLPEYCTGSSEFCPNDVFKVDGTQCKIGQAFCYEGTCRTHSDQCKLLWGPSGKKSDNQCYEQNRKGTRHGNCGYNRVNQSYVPCRDEDVRCGMLHCSHLNERLEFGMESVAILSHSFINSGGRIIPCRTALVDLGLNDVDPGLAPEGARCSDGSLCVNQKCIPVASLKVGPKSCPNDCNGHGTCNSKGHCHCDTGYAPPYCSLQGAGGSEDSGPASEPYSSSAWVTWIILCLIFIPFSLLCIFATYHRRKIIQISKEGTTEDWRLWIENVNPVNKFKRHSDVDGTRPSRPTSLLTHVDISAPMIDENGQSSTSSPTHALLPHVDTSTSALSAAIVSEKVQKECSLSEYDDKRGTSGSGGILGNIAAGIERSKTKLRSKSLYGNSSKDSSDKSGQSSKTSSKRGFMETLAKSISLPSPRLRSTMKNNMHGSSKAHYEITVEHQEPRKDSGDQSPPILTPCDIEDKSCELSDYNSAPNSNTSMHKTASKDELDSTKPFAFEVKKVDTTVTVTDSNNLITSSKSLSSFATNRMNGSYRTTLPLSKSYSYRNQNNSTNEKELVSDSSKSKSSVEKEIDTTSLTSSALPSEQPINKNESMNSSKNDMENSTQSSVSVNNNLQSDKDRSRFPSTKKYAFPQSFTFSGRSSANASKTFLPSSKSCDSTTAKQPLSSKIEGNNVSSQSPTCSQKETLGSQKNEDTTHIGIEKKSNNDLVSSKSTQGSTLAFKNTTVVKPSIAKKPPTPPRKPNYLKTKETSDSMKIQTVKSENAKDKVALNSAESVVVGAETKPRTNNEPKHPLCSEHSKLSPITQKPSSVNSLLDKGPKPVSALVHSPNCTTAPSSLPQTNISENPMPLPKTTTIPTLSSIGESKSSMSKSSTLPAVHASRPLISRPILQNATPCATSLIERAPSTGVSQSSILGGGNKIGKADKTARGVVFCEPLTLPSPTNPNHPPIIHQQSISSSSSTTSTQSNTSTTLGQLKDTTKSSEKPIQRSIASIVPEKSNESSTTVVLPNTTTVDFTPTWKTEPKALPADAFICNIDAGKGQKTNDKHTSLAVNNSITPQDISTPSPDSEKSVGQFSKLKSKLAHVKRTPTSERHKIDKSEKNNDENRSLSPTSSLSSVDGPPKPERSNLRSLQISNPILQTAVDIKTSLVPVCRANDETVTNQYADSTRSSSISPAPASVGSSSTPTLSVRSDSSTSSSLSKPESALKNKGKAPQPPQSSKIATASKDSDYSKSKPSPAENRIKDDDKNKSLLTNISRRLSNRSKHSERRDSAPEACTTVSTTVPNSPSVSSIVKTSADGKIIKTDIKVMTSPLVTKHSANEIDKSGQSSKSRRPASIATSRPVRPTAPPPRPPSNSRSQISPTRSDTSSITSSSSIVPGNHKSEPIYHTIRENPLEEKTEAISITSPLSDDFVTPTSSPIMTRRNSDTLSTGSSTDGGDLMNAILKEMSTKSKEEEEESVYSTLMRKKKNRVPKSNKDK